jgi:hypothetical protein
MDNSDRPHILIFEDADSDVSVWIRPNYALARRTLGAWLAIKMVEFIEEQDEDDQEDTYNEIMQDRPDFAIAPLWEINHWLIDHDIGCEVDIFPVTLSVDPLREFIETRLRTYPQAMQEYLRHKVLRSIGDELSWPKTLDYTQLSLDELPTL